MTLLEDDINNCCADIEFNNKFRQIVNWTTLDTQSTVNNIYMSYQQLLDKLADRNEKIERITLSNLNLERSNSTLKKKISVYQRIMIQIKMQNVPRLHDIIRTCMNAKRSMWFLVG